MSKDIKGKTKQGIYWNVSLKVPYEIFHFVLSIIIARVLEPKDFGIMSIAMMAIYYSNTITNFGFNQAIVQRKDISPHHIDAVFTFDLAFSALLMAVFYLAASPIASFFNSPESENVIKVLSLLFIITTFHDMPYTLLRREVNFKYIAIISNGRELMTSLITLVLALQGFRYWSLVIGRLVPLVAATVYLMYKAEWRPRITLQLAALKDIVSFGFWNIINSQTSFFSSRIDRIVLGRAFNPAILGLYDKAKSFTQIPTESIASNINTVLFSSFSRVQSSTDEVTKIFRKGLVLISVVIFPIYLGLYAVGPHFILVLLGEKWRPMIPALQILSLGGIFTSLDGLFSSVAVGTGSYKSYTTRLIAVTLLLSAGSILIVKFGMEVLAIGVVLFSVLLCYLGFTIIKDKFQLGWKELARCLFPALLCSSLMLVIVKACSLTLFREATVVNLLSLVTIGIVSYATMMMVMPASSLDEVRQSFYKDINKVWGNVKYFLRV